MTLIAHKDALYIPVAQIGKESDYGSKKIGLLTITLEKLNDFSDHS